MIRWIDDEVVCLPNLMLKRESDSFVIRHAILDPFFVSLVLVILRLIWLMLSLGNIKRGGRMMKLSIQMYLQSLFLSFLWWRVTRHSGVFFQTNYVNNVLEYWWRKNWTRDREITNQYFSFPTTNLEIHRTIGFIDPKVDLETDEKEKQTEDVTQLTITLRMTQMAGQFEIL